MTLTVGQHCQHFTSVPEVIALMIRGRSRTSRGRGGMFEQTIGGTLRNFAIGLVLTAALVGAGFALALA